MRSTFLTLALASAASACAAGSAGAQTINPKTLQLFNASQILAKPLEVTTFSWTVHNAPILLPPVATHICLLTGFSGKLAGDGELVRLYIDKSASGGPHFMLGGKSGQGELKLTASCARRDQFVVPSTTQWGETVFDIQSASGCGNKAIQTGAGTSQAQFLAALGGRFAGDGENVMAGKGMINIAACSGTVSAGALAIGQLFGTPIYRTPDGRTGDAAKATFVSSFKSNWKDNAWFTLTGSMHISSTGTIFMSPVNDALCGIVGISGKYNGYGEVLSVEREGKNGEGWWVARVGAGYGANEPSVAVSMRCLSRDQRKL